MVGRSSLMASVIKTVNLDSEINTYVYARSKGNGDVTVTDSALINSDSTYVVDKATVSYSNTRKRGIRFTNVFNNGRPSKPISSVDRVAEV